MDLSNLLKLFSNQKINNTVQEQHSAPNPADKYYPKEATKILETITTSEEQTQSQNSQSSGLMGNISNLLPLLGMMNGGGTSGILSSILGSKNEQNNSDKNPLLEALLRNKNANQEKEKTEQVVEKKESPQPEIVEEYEKIDIEE